MRARNVKALTQIDYEIPERYRNAFYLANAAFFDSTNWFLHRAYEVYFPTLRSTYRQYLEDANVREENLDEKLENLVESLDQCNSIIDLRFPIRRDNGSLEIIRGFRAHYGEAVQNSPCLGGLRLNEKITRDHMKALSVLSALKSFCMGTGLSGAMGGIKIDPKLYSERELGNIVRRYATELFRKGYCNHGDIISPDINTSSREMIWFSEAFAQFSGQGINAVSTGKPLEYGGIDGYYLATALGAFKALQTFINNSELMVKTGCNITGLQNKTFIIQGLGKVGKPLSQMLVESGAVCIGVKEYDAYLYNAKGIDLNELYQYKHKHGTIDKYGLSKTEHPDSIFTEDCDILILAACQKSLVCHVARDVKARVILEAADGPITPMAHKILTTKSKLIVPDIYACSGGSVMSYFEYLRNLQQIGVAAENVLKFSTKIYTNIFDGIVLDQEQQRVGRGIETRRNIFAPLDCNFVKNSLECVYSEVGQEVLTRLNTFKLGLDVRTAAYTLAIQNMFKALFQKGEF